MPWQVLCPDGVDRVVANWRTQNEAEQDALYFTARGSCSTWTFTPGDCSCPRGAHVAVNDDIGFCFDA